MHPMLLVGKSDIVLPAISELRISTLVYLYLVKDYNISDLYLKGM